MLRRTLFQRYCSPILFKNSSSSEESDLFEDETLKLISQMLMEEDDVENKQRMEQESLALQATERSFYDILGKTYPPDEKKFDCRINDSPDDNSSSNSCASVTDFRDLDWVRDRERIEQAFYAGYMFDSVLHSICSTKCLDKVEKTADLAQQTNPGKNLLKRGSSPNRSGENRDSIDERQIDKLLASSNVGIDDEANMFDEVLLCLQPNRHLDPKPPMCLGSGFNDDGIRENTKQLRKNGKSKREKSAKKRQDNNKEMVDLTSLLIHCAEAVSISDMLNADKLLKKIRQHSSPYGDGYERAAHYFADALEARVAGTGTALYTASQNRFRTISASDMLKGYQTYIEVSPFIKMSDLFANRSIAKVSEKAKKIHIIGLGIMYGFQYPCLIQQLSERPGGPPKVRITGIDFPQPGFRPAERLEETGHRLYMYCKRFCVPFEYTAIAKKWETIELSDLKIQQDEVLVVNSLYQLKNVLDETVIESSPRDAVLDLVKRIKPDLFIHGVLNGTYNAPFFVTRFKEALFSFCARFDMFETNASREERGRWLFERELYARDIMNVVACEGSERVERPESYKQWHFRSVRAGLRQEELDREIVKKVRAKVKAHYHKDYVVDEDNNWMLLGWKGRIIYASSCWKSVD